MKKITLIYILLYTILFASNTDIELALWNDVKNSNDITMLKIYLKKYPNGIFSEIAKLKIRKLILLNDNSSIKNLLWWKSDAKIPFKYYGVGSSGSWAVDPEAIAKKRAIENLKEQIDYSSQKNLNIKFLKHTTKYGKVFILAYMDNEI